ncbi:hypothetical protein [Rhodococcus sp. NPDC058521]|uniref:hypothetical protein n=1 Tax=Rhodococcus sp. NPDC058521 TaxID=3346536 RepID=UPI0036664EC9
MTTEPRAALVEPIASDPVPDVLENALSGSYLSPTYWLTAPVMGALGLIGVEKNPIDIIADDIAGDWQAVQEAGLAVRSLGEFNSQMSEALSTAMSTTSESWDGDAAASASDYFGELARAIESQKFAINSMGSQIDSLAIGMYEASEAVKGLLGTATDLMVQFLLELAAAGATALLTATGLGAVVAAASWAAALRTGWKLYEVISKIPEILGYALQGAEAAAGVITGYMGAVRDVKFPALPGAAYDHSEV